MSKIHDGIMGLVVGDALGVPYEFKARGSFYAEDMVGYGTHNQPPGTWSDDSSMTLATLKSLVDCHGIDLNDIMKNFKRWLFTGAFTPWKHTFDVGNTTRRAIDRYKHGVSVYGCGGAMWKDNGNGALMRILPLAFADAGDKEIDAVSGLTHNHEISKAGCRLYVEIARQIMKGESLEWILEYGLGSMPAEYVRIPSLKYVLEDDIRSSGYVVDTLEAALWCLLHSGSYKNAVLMAVNLGNDTDTVAAVTGGLAGLMYGVGEKKGGIPEEWIKQIPRRTWIKKLCTMFEK